MHDFKQIKAFTPHTHPDVDVAAAGIENGQAVCYLRRMVDNKWTRAARLAPGDRIDLRLIPWQNVKTSWAASIAASWAILTCNSGSMHGGN